MILPSANNPDFAHLMAHAVATPPLSESWMPKPFQFLIGHGRVGKTDCKTAMDCRWRYLGPSDGVS